MARSNHGRASMLLSLPLLLTLGSANPQTFSWDSEVASEPFDADEYVAWHVRATSDGSFRLFVWGIGDNDNAHHLSVFRWIVDPEFREQSFRWVTLTRGNVGLAAASTAVPASAQAHVMPCPTAVARCVLGIWYDTALPPGEWWIVVLAGMDEPHVGEIRFIGSPGVEVLESRVGSASLVFGRDFPGSAVGWASVLPATAAIVPEASVTQLAASSLFAAFVEFGSEGHISYEGPSGASTGSSWYDIPGGPPGTYRFEIRDLHEVSLYGEILLISADIRLS